MMMQSDVMDNLPNWTPTNSTSFTWLLFSLTWFLVMIMEQKRLQIRRTVGDQIKLKTRQDLHGIRDRKTYRKWKEKE